ncbi:pantoate--beta-alanine ligase [Sphingobium sp. DEHP117]|uniref:pantoate--beta-alanine ligase n=1 Tax=Sphingobium sp. DEHP117 TaxID=2993436 RepID=UPI0027D758A2|nr:pantoate--beta-alanine ligase [Sphingobium sp. DEHP117]MDQ4421753.1 pantoate--beta-alanine ligase [Sphingobium sp. DEHP117]
MQIVRDVPALRSAISALKVGGGRVALVPTMGALHEGHMSLVRRARDHADHVVASIFVNPMQFGKNEDLDAYPRQEARDAAMLEAEGVAILWAPTVEAMYPAGFATTISVSGVSEGLCGAARPGHFDGVATVVAKLFNQVRPDVALFGEKDFQQLAVIRRMATDLDMGLGIIGVETARAEDGLALSSRNAYLTAEERARAVALPDSMREAVAVLEAGAEVDGTLVGVKNRLAAAGFGPIDYVELVDAGSLQPVRRIGGPARLLVAARLGTTRLIDNMAVSAPGIRSL